MNKILLIISREYLSRVKKRSFLIMTLLGPLLMAGVMIVPVWLSGVTQGVREVVVVDETKQFINQLRNTSSVKFNYVFAEANLDSVRSIYKEVKDVSVLFIPRNILISNQVIMHSSDQPGLNVLSYISNEMSSIIERSKLVEAKIDPNVIDHVKTVIDIKNNVGEEEKNDQLNLAISLFLSVLIYMFIFMYGSQVMRGVIEEKTSRIIEVIISSVKPFQLMMGKIVGIALVGLTQFVLWIILTFSIAGVGQSLIVNSKMASPENIQHIMKSSAPQKEKAAKKLELNEAGKKIIENITRINWPLIIGSFLFYFLGGYLLYSALFAAIGSAVDSEADTQQLMLPITVPLIISFSVYSKMIEQPDGPIAFWFSMIPFTSPITMMLRIPYGVQAWELLLSMSLLILGFLFTTWLAGRIYRTGILMYGKKVTYKELWKWLFYKG